MDTKKIKKLEDLDGHKWYYNGNYYELRVVNNTLDLNLTNHINIIGELTKVFLFPVSLNNLSALRPLNLNIEVEEQPELKKSERFFISKFTEDFYIARDEDGVLCIFNQIPIKGEIKWLNNNTKNTSFNETHAHYLEIAKSLFPFITWESGKYWSKKEILELEVE